MLILLLLMFKKAMLLIDKHMHILLIFKIITIIKRYAFLIIVLKQ